MKKYQILPKTLSLIITYKCSAACENCCFECSPQRQEELSLFEAKKYIDDVSRIFPSIRTIVLTGGEVFLNVEKAICLLAHAKKKGLNCRIVTNGFWASSKEKAYNILEKCKDAGLDEINFSTGDDHLSFVPIKNITNAIFSALSLDITTVVNIESGKGREFDRKKLLEKLDTSFLSTKSNRFSIINGMWMPFTQESLNALQPINKEYYHPAMDRCTNLFSGITISPNCHLLACCGLPVKYIKYLDLGNLYKNDVKDLFLHQFNDFLKIWLFVEGPYKILLFVEKVLKNEVPELKVLSHMCFYCACLFTNQKYLATAKHFYNLKYESVILRFYLLLNQMKKK